MKILIVYYTDSGSTRELAETIAANLSSNTVTEIKEVRDKFEVTTDWVIICTPNKYGKPASAVIRFMKKHREQLKEVSVCFTCMDCYDSVDETTRSLPVYIDRTFAAQKKERSNMNSWEKSHSVDIFIEVLEQLLMPGSLHSVAFFKGSLCFQKLGAWDTLVMRFISLTNPRIRQGYYLKKEEVAVWSKKLSSLMETK